MMEMPDLPWGPVSVSNEATLWASIPPSVKWGWRPVCLQMTAGGLHGAVLWRALQRNALKQGLADYGPGSNVAHGPSL